MKIILKPNTDRYVRYALYGLINNIFVILDISEYC